MQMFISKALFERSGCNREVNDKEKIPRCSNSQRPDRVKEIELSVCKCLLASCQKIVHIPACLLRLRINCQVATSTDYFSYQEPPLVYLLAFQTAAPHQSTGGDIRLGRLSAYCRTGLVSPSCTLLLQLI